MFNDLNNPNVSGHAAVDDIFAETDKPALNGNQTGGQSSNQSEIETHRVGLTATGEKLPLREIEHEPAASKNNYVKIIIIVLVSLGLLGGIYLVYSQFIAKDNNPVATSTVKVETPNTNTPTNTTNPINNNFVSDIPGVNLEQIATNSATSADLLSPTPLAGEISNIVSSSTTTVSTIDSDNDGLTDVEEIAVGTNPNVIDTDIDGLSDYEELKIYHTNPLLDDTDGDGYLDGAEVKSGYDPNVKGAKLPGNIATSSIPVTK
jgi:hypothetical protein